MSNFQDAVIANTSAVNRRFKNIRITCNGGERNLISFIEAQVGTGFCGFWIQNNSGASITLYTGTGKSATGFPLADTLTSPYYAFVATPETGLYFTTVSVNFIHLVVFFP